MFRSSQNVQYLSEISFPRPVPLFSLLGSVAWLPYQQNVNQSCHHQSLVSPSDDLTIGTKRICANQQGNFSNFEWKTTLLIIKSAPITVSEQDPIFSFANMYLTVLVMFSVTLLFCIIYYFPLCSARLCTVCCY